jgi:hypothetical protein
MRRIFWGFCRNWVLIDTSHYLSSRSAFGFEFTEIFVIEKTTPRVGESAFECLKEKFGESESLRLPDLANRRVANSPTRRVVDSPTRRVGESPWCVGESVFEFFKI